MESEPPSNIVASGSTSRTDHRESSKSNNSLNLPGAESSGNGTGDHVDETFLGKNSTHRWRVAVLDFRVVGDELPDAIGKTVAAGLRPYLDDRRFILLERSQIAEIIQEHDLAAVGLSDEGILKDMRRLANASLLVVGTVSRVDGILIDARMVDTGDGRIVRQGQARATDLASIGGCLNALGDRLSASDHRYAKLRQAKFDSPYPDCELRELVRDNGSLVITFYISTGGKSELQLYRTARQFVRDQFASYCQNELGLDATHSELINFCRENEQVDEVRPFGARKLFVYRVPLPNQWK